MHVALLATPAELAALRPQWESLAVEVPFRSWQWLESWWNVYGAGQTERDRSLFVLAVRGARGELLGLAPCYRQRTASRGTVVRLIGTGEVCSEYLAILSRLGAHEQVAAALAEWFWKANAAENTSRDHAWDLIELSTSHQADDVATRLAAHMAERGAMVDRRNGAPCWKLALPESWEDYLALLSKSHRKQVRQLDRRYFGSGRALLHEVRNTQELEQGRRMLEDLHQQRRASLGQKGCFANPAFHAFIEQASPALLAAGMLRLCWVEIDGRPAAVEYQLLSHTEVFAYQAGIDPQSLIHQPGSLITLATIRRAIGEGRRAMDFLRGDEPYKAHWRAKPQPTTDMRIVADCSAARLRHRAWLASLQAKSLLRSGLRASGIHRQN